MTQSNRPPRQEKIMRQKMLEALRYPITYVLQDIDRRDCPHGGVFKSPSDRCQFCNIKTECHWLSCIDKFADIEDKSTCAIHATLLFGIDLIEANIQSLKHDPESCTCEDCTWVRSAQKLAQEFENSNIEDLYRLVY